MPDIQIKREHALGLAEARKIATPAYRQQIAESIAEGVRVYANLVEGVRRQRAARR